MACNGFGSMSFDFQLEAEEVFFLFLAVLDMDGDGAFLKAGAAGRVEPDEHFAGLAGLVNFVILAGAHAAAGHLDAGDGDWIGAGVFEWVGDGNRG